jgi:hypothetical protein
MPRKYKLIILVLVISNMLSFGALGLNLSRRGNTGQDTVAVNMLAADRMGDQPAMGKVAVLANTPEPTGTIAPTFTLIPTLTPASTQTATATRTATRTATATRTRTATRTFTPVLTRTLTATRTLTSTLPAATVPAATVTPVPATATPSPTVPPAQPAASTEWDPQLSDVHYVSFHPADVAPGQQYWHLTKMIYCDAYAPTDPRIHNYGCDEMPGGPTGTSIYIMDGGAPFNAIAGGINYGDRTDVTGGLKSPSDPCNCSYTFEVSNYLISIRGLPSDSIEGFCLCSTNGAPILDGHAHVRYFLYWAIVTR